VKTALAIGADINERNSLGNAPIHIAASCGCLDIAQQLINAGADLGTLNAAGETAAEVAASRGHAELAAVLDILMAMKSVCPKMH
jgi:ankyrin repeat protein